MLQVSPASLLMKLHLPALHVPELHLVTVMQVPLEDTVLSLNIKIFSNYRHSGKGSTNIDTILSRWARR